MTKAQKNHRFIIRESRRVNQLPCPSTLLRPHMLRAKNIIKAKDGAQDWEYKAILARTYGLQEAYSKAFAA